MIRKARFFILSILVFFSLLSCDDRQVFDQYRTVSSSWEADEKIEFELPQLDSLQKYNLFINIRNNSDYKYSNLFLISKIKFPNGKVVTDTLEYEMAAPDGEWLGTGFADIKENKLFYKENVRFVEDGIYQVVVQHAMRKNGQINGIGSLEGISDVGFRIEFAEKP